MKNVSTGFGLCVAAAAALAYPFVSSLAPNANAVGIGTTSVAAVSAAATAQATPTIVWYGASQGQYLNQGVVYRAWSDGKVELRMWYWQMASGCSSPTADFCSTPWKVVSDPAQGLTFDADLNFDEAVNGDDLGLLLAKWGPAPRNPVPPSDCPLALINP